MLFWSATLLSATIASCHAAFDGSLSEDQVQFVLDNFEKLVAEDVKFHMVEFGNQLLEIVYVLVFYN
jgi:hypothetical protein